MKIVLFFIDAGDGLDLDFEIAINSYNKLE
jgi:hypothetical protein